MTIKDEIFKEKKSCSKKGFTYSYTKRQKKPEKAVGNYGQHDITTIIYGYSVGFKKLYQPFLSRAISWILEGIEKKEALGELYFHQYRLASALALAHWINSGVDDIFLWKQAIDWQEKLYSDQDFLNNIGKIRKEDYALQILHYIQAKEYDKAIQLYQSKNGDKPFKLNEKMSGMRVAYAYCLYFYDKRFSLEQVEKSSRYFLEKELPMLYTKGRPQEMLYWLKTVCDAREKIYTPEEVIYTFYEYIPEEETPSFIKELLNPLKKKSWFSFFKW